MEGMGSKTKTTSSITLMKQIYKNHGFSGLYKGNLITVMREMPAYAGNKEICETISSNILHSSIWYI